MTMAPDYESSPLRVFLEADKKTQKELALEAFREGNDLLRDFSEWREYLTGDDSWDEELEDLDWLYDLAATSTDLREQVKSLHVVEDDELPDEPTAADYAVMLIQEGLDRTTLDPDGKLHSTFHDLDFGVRVACVVAAGTIPHPSSHEPLTTLDGLGSTTLLDVFEYMTEELEWMNEEGARLLATTPWDEDQLESALYVYGMARTTTDDGPALPWLELFAREHDWSESKESDFRAAYARSFAVAPVRALTSEHQQQVDVVRDNEVREIVPSTPSALLLEVWWQTIQQNEPHRLTKDLLTAFIANENTPDAIRDEAQIELDFHYAD